MKSMSFKCVTFLHLIVLQVVWSKKWGHAVHQEKLTPDDLVPVALLKRHARRMVRRYQWRHRRGGVWSGGRPCCTCTKGGSGNWLWPTSALFWLWGGGLGPHAARPHARQLWMRIYHGNSVNFDSERKTHEMRDREAIARQKRQSLHWLIVVLCSWYGVGSAQRIQTVIA